MLPRRFIAKLGIACLAAMGCWSTAQAQINLTGAWSNQADQDFDLRLNGPWPYTFVGVPLNAAALKYALAQTPDTISQVDRQCQPYPTSYIFLGPQGPGRIWPTVSLDGTVIAWNLEGIIDRRAITIWMDGRSPPSAQAAHSPEGFTTGRWVGDTLVTTTTHMQAGYMTRNGVPNSDRETLVMFFTRRDNMLTVTGVVHDPVYLSAPLVISTVATVDPTSDVGSASSLNATCTPIEETESSSAEVPTYLTTPEDQLMFATINYGIPHDAAMGGAQTMYPEYIQQIAGQYKRPAEYCKTNCCGTGGAGPNGAQGFNFAANVLKCNQFRP